MRDIFCPHRFNFIGWHPAMKQIQNFKTNQRKKTWKNGKNKENRKCKRKKSKHQINKFIEGQKSN